MTKKYYTITHEHRYGIDTHTFCTEKEGEDIPELNEIIKLLGIDFEPNKWDEVVNWDDCTVVNLDKLMQKDTS